jgi:3'-5' exoribonuclease
VADLVPGCEARGVYALKKKVCREQPGGALFLLFQFSDRTGVINGVLWDGAAATQHEIAAGDLVHVQGEVQVYQNTRQIKVRQIVRADPAGYDLSEFLPTSTQDLDALYARVMAMIDTVRDTWLRRLYTDMFTDPDLARGFSTHRPAKAGIMPTSAGCSSTWCRCWRSAT